MGLRIISNENYFGVYDLNFKVCLYFVQISPNINFPNEM